jgi:AcrR family transcriptional regulator
MTAETYQRARRPEQKLERREAILDAARELALRDGVRSVSLAGIAERVGVPKSALLRYFETREQIFLELTAAAWRDWVAALHAELGGQAGDEPGASGDGSGGGVSTRDTLVRDETSGTVPDCDGSGGGALVAARDAALVADVFARSFGDRPLLCDLIAHTPLNLERNVSPEGVRRYKLTSLGAVDEAAALVHQTLPGLTLDECGEFVAAVASLAGAVWQMANPGPALTELYASDPALTRACIDLTGRLRRTGEILLAGLVPSRV